MTIRLTPRATSCIGMGIVAQTFWQLPGVLRSDSARLRRGWPASCPYHARTRWMSRMDWTARLAGYMNWMGRCCCSAWITPPIPIHLGEYMRRARYRRKNT